MCKLALVAPHILMQASKNRSRTFNSPKIGKTCKQKGYDGQKGLSIRYRQVHPYSGRLGTCLPCFSVTLL